jgi:uroporphyrinogen-III synthase/uroporphyrinogen III methyltransferase/synthase
MTPTLLNTRPQGQTQALSQALAVAGFGSVDCPVMAIEALGLPNRAVETLVRADKLVFVSRNAVQKLAQAWQALMGRPLTPAQDMKRDARCFAIGAATQQALEAQGWPTASLEHEDFVSEALLARTDWQDLHGQTVLLIKGEGGRLALIEGLRAAGADVESWPVYRRALPDYTRQQWQNVWQDWAQSDWPTVLISSWQGFEHLQALVERFGHKNDQAWLFQQPAIVFSERIAQGLSEQGWRGPCRVVRPQSQGGIIQTLKQWATE